MKHLVLLSVITCMVTMQAETSNENLSPVVVEDQGFVVFAPKQYLPVFSIDGVRNFNEFNDRLSKTLFVEYTELLARIETNYLRMKKAHVFNFQRNTLCSSWGRDAGNKIAINDFTREFVHELDFDNLLTAYNPLLEHETFQQFRDKELDLRYACLALKERVNNEYRLKVALGFRIASSRPDWQQRVTSR